MIAFRDTDINDREEVEEGEAPRPTKTKKIVYWSGDIEHKLYNQTTYSKLPFLYLVILISSKILVMFNKITMVLRTYFVKIDSIQ